jgi:hypothetical protein
MGLCVPNMNYASMSLITAAVSSQAAASVVTTDHQLGVGKVVALERASCDPRPPLAQLEHLEHLERGRTVRGLV